ncbi:hypothetical protein Q5424_27465, partial [Conexibacter sp. JD483]
MPGSFRQNATHEVSKARGRLRRTCLALLVGAASLAAADIAAAADPARLPANCTTTGATGITCTGTYGQSVTLSRFENLAAGDIVEVTARNFADGALYGVAGQTTTVRGIGEFNGNSVALDAAAYTPAGQTFELVLHGLGGDILREQSFVNVGDSVAEFRETDPREGTASGWDAVAVPTYFRGQADHGAIAPLVDQLYLPLANRAVTAPNGNELLTFGFAPGEVVSYSLRDTAGREATVRDIDLVERTIGQIAHAADQLPYRAYSWFYVPSRPGLYTLTARGATSGIVRTAPLEVLDPGVTADASATTVTDPRSGLKVTVSKTRGLDPDGERVLVTYTDNPTVWEVQQEILPPVHGLGVSLTDGTWLNEQLLSRERPMTSLTQLSRINREGSFVVEVNRTVPRGRWFTRTELATEQWQTPDALEQQSYLSVGETRSTAAAAYVPLSFAGSRLPAPSSDQHAFFARVTPGPLHPGDEVQLSTWFFYTAATGPGAEIAFTTDIPGVTIPSKRLGKTAWGTNVQYLEQSFRLPASTPAGRYTVTATDTGTGGRSLPFTVTVPSLPAVTAGPADTTVLAGSDASFSATADGFPQPSVTWQTRSSPSADWAEIPDATATTLTLPAVRAADSGSQYRARFENEAGTVESAAATLTVTPAPAPPAVPAAVAATTSTRLSLSAVRSRYGAARSATVAVRRADGAP